MLPVCTLALLIAGGTVTGLLWRAVVDRIETAEKDAEDEAGP